MEKGDGGGIGRPERVVDELAVSYYLLIESEGIKQLYDRKWVDGGYRESVT